MAKVKIKTLNSKDDRRKIKLLEILSKNDIYATRITYTPDGFVIFTNDETDLDKLFNGETDRLLVEDGFTPQIPIELKTQRTVKIFNVDNHIYNHEVEDMCNELMDKNPFTSNQVHEIFKFPRAKIRSVTFTKTNVAKKAAEQGLKMFSMSIPPTK